MSSDVALLGVVEHFEARPYLHTWVGEVTLRIQAAFLSPAAPDSGTSARVEVPFPNSVYQYAYLVPVAVGDTLLVFAEAENDGWRLCDEPLPIRRVRAGALITSSACGVVGNRVANIVSRDLQEVLDELQDR